MPRERHTLSSCVEGWWLSRRAGSRRWPSRAARSERRRCSSASIEWCRGSSWPSRRRSADTLVTRRTTWEEKPEPGEEAVGLAVLGRHVAADLLAPAGVGVEGHGAHQLAGDAVLAGVGDDVELVDGDAGGVGERGERAGGGDGEPDRAAVGGRDVGADVLAVQGGGDAALGRGPGGDLGADAGLDAGGHPELGEGPLLVRGDTPDADRGTAHRGSSIVALGLLTTATAPPAAVASKGDRGRTLGPFDGSS